MELPPSFLCFLLAKGSLYASIYNEKFKSVFMGTWATGDKLGDRVCSTCFGGKNFFLFARSLIYMHFGGRWGRGEGRYFRK